MTFDHERSTALERLCRSFEEQGCSPTEILAILEHRTNLLRMKIRDDVLEDMSATCGTDPQYLYSVAARLVQKMTDEEIAEYRAEYLPDYESLGLPPISDQIIVKQIRALQAAGFVVGKRDPNMNRAFAGRFMVAEAYEPGTTQDDAQGGDGVWCIVGDDMATLVREAFSFFSDTLPKEDN